jgi:serine/threonine protein kinase
MAVIGTGTFGVVVLENGRVTKIYRGPDRNANLVELITELDVYSGLKRSPSIPQSSMNVSFVLDPPRKISLSMRYMGDHLKREYSLSQIKSIIYQLTEQLYVLHATDNVHLDIRPANVLLDDHGQVTLIDFGMSKIRYVKDAVTLLNIRPPELFPSSTYRHTTIESVDIWMLGILLLYLLNPEVEGLFSSDLDQQFSVIEHMVEHLSGKEVYRPFGEAISGFSRESKDLLFQTMVKRTPAKRLLRHEFFKTQWRDIPHIEPLAPAVYSVDLPWTRNRWQTLSVLMDWIMTILRKFEITPHAILITFDLTYRYTDLHQNWDVRDMQLTACSSMYISSLILDSEVIYDDIVWIADEFTKESLEKRVQSVVRQYGLEMRRANIQSAIKHVYPELSLKAQQNLKPIIDM